MFRGLINDAKSAVGSVVARYVARASVALPFLVAMGFATAAVTLTLVDRYGAIAAYWMVAGGFTAVGLIAALAVSVKEQGDEAADTEAQSTDTGETANAVLAQAPLALAGALLSSSFGPGSLVGGAKLAARNIPLLVLLAAIAFLLWPTDRTNAEAAGAAPDDPTDEIRSPDEAAIDPTTKGLHRKAA